MTEATYTLRVTETQAKVLCTACEVLARLGIGQFRDALAHLPVSDTRTVEDVQDWFDDLDTVGGILSRHALGGVDGWNSSLSVYYEKVKPEAKIAWDLFQVLRHRLEWDRGGDFSLTLPASEQPLAKIERSEAA